MARLMDITLRESSSTMVGPDTWQEMLAFTLRGSIDRDRSGGTVTYTDRWSGTEIEITVASGDVAEIAISGNTYVNGERIYKETTRIEFPDQRIPLDRLENAFRDFMDTGLGDPLAPLSRFSAEYTADDPVPPSLPGTYYKLWGTGQNDIYNLADAGNYIYGSRGNDDYRGGRQLDTVDFLMVDFRFTGSRERGGGVEYDKSDGSTDRLNSVETLLATPGNDNIKAGLQNGNTSISGFGGNDKIGGQDGDDVLDGGDGNDQLWGRNGHDLLIGGAGNDTIRGGDGNDILVAGTGFTAFQDERNTLFGNNGRDLFVLTTPGQFTGANVQTIIRDFQDGRDFIGLATFPFSTTPDVQFDDLAITKQGRDSLISLNGDEIAIVRNTAPRKLDRDDFVEGVDVVGIETFFGVFEEWLV